MGVNDIGQDRFQSRLTKELRISGTMPAPVLAPEIVPVLVVEGERPELLYLQRERRMSCTLSLGPVVGEHYYFQLWNPAGRNGIIVVEEIGIGSQAGTNGCDFGYADAAVSGSLGVRASYCLDSRVPGRAPQAGVAEPLCGTDPAAGLIDTFGRTMAFVDGWITYHPNLVLTPGYGFGLWGVVANSDVVGYCFWRERQAMDGELT